MKRYFAAAAALLLGTSAMAWAPAGTTDSKWVEAGAKMTRAFTALAAEEQMKKAVLDTFADAKAEMTGDAMAWADSTFKAEPAAWTAEAPKFQPAAATWVDDEPKLQPSAAWNEEGPAIGNADIAYGDWKADDGGDAKADMADEEEEVATDEASVDGSELETPLTPVENKGMGGPEEPIAGDLSPRPAAHNYPPCDPGPGDDNCIQLYEPGVRTALASWSAPTGGLMNSSATTAMGGPYEPVDAGMATAAAEHHAGMGGPARETGYPPCSGSPSDDRCIQLYEPGVTGAGN